MSDDMKPWSPQQIELRDILLDRLSCVTGEAIGGRISAGCTVAVLSTLDDLGWAKQKHPESEAEE